MPSSSSTSPACLSEREVCPYRVIHPLLQYPERNRNLRPPRIINPTEFLVLLTKFNQLRTSSIMTRNTEELNTCVQTIISLVNNHQIPQQKETKSDSESTSSISQSHEERSEDTQWLSDLNAIYAHPEEVDTTSLYFSFTVIYFY